MQVYSNTFIQKCKKILVDMVEKALPILINLEIHFMYHTKINYMDQNTMVLCNLLV